MKPKIFRLSHIFQVVTPVGVIVITLPSVPLSPGFVPTPWNSSVGFLGSYTSESVDSEFKSHSEESTLPLDFSSGHTNLPSVIITRRCSLGTKVEQARTGSSTNRKLPNQKLVSLTRVRATLAVSLVSGIIKESITRRQDFVLPGRVPEERCVMTPGGSLITRGSTNPRILEIPEFQLRRFLWERTEIQNGRKNRWTLFSTISFF